MGELRPYQTDLVSRLSRSWRLGHKAPCIVLPCGGGKSVIVAEIARRTTENGKLVLFLVHRKELCDQIRNTFKWWGVDMDLCNIMMVQTAARKLQRMECPSLIITDENHHSKASTYQKIYDAFSSAYRVGVTATPVRIDGSGLGDVNDDLIIGVSAKWLIENNCLAPYDYYAPSDIDMSSLHTRHGEYDMSEAEEMLSDKCVYGDVIRHYNEYAKGLKAVCYCVSIGYSKRMAQEFCDSGIPAAHIDGSTPKSERDRIIADFRNGSIKILCNVDLISEGFDVPDCGCAILLRPTKSLTLYIQQSMRCMRYKEGKRAVILDHVGNVRRFGMPDDDREWSLDVRKKKSEDEFDVISCEYCFFTFPKINKGGKRAVCCPNCHMPLKKADSKNREADREPTEEKGAVLEKVTEVHVIPAMPSQCRTYSDLAAYARAKGYKPGWIYHTAKRMGIQPYDRRTQNTK
jgi:superfamily II DNA or RNA helicase|nr:MAG TPA: Chromatin remodeling complex ATPase [Caudoviricetes sp.]